MPALVAEPTTQLLKHPKSLTIDGTGLTTPPSLAPESSPLRAGVDKTALGIMVMQAKRGRAELRQHGAILDPHGARPTTRPPTHSPGNSRADDHVQTAGKGILVPMEEDGKMQSKSPPAIRNSAERRSVERETSNRR